MSDGDAGKKAEMPEGSRGDGGGTTGDSTATRQALTAHQDQARDELRLLMEEVLHPDNIEVAYERVLENDGAPGVDGMTVGELAAYRHAHWTRIREELLNRTYVPQPVRKVEIPKADGKGMRMLGIPTVLDRMIQQALLQVLHFIFDPTFSDSSFGFRLGRGTHNAIQRAREHIAAGYRWVVDLDLAKFFDRVNHDILMSRVARRVKDKRVLHLIRRYLQAGILEGGLVSPRVEGTPQGGPLSPLLSNIMLDELDKELERRGHRFVRYADDCNVYVQSKAAGDRVMASLERFLTKRLRLVVNRDKSAVAPPWERKFLGYSVTKHHKTKLRVSPQSASRLKAKLQPILRGARGVSMAMTIGKLGPILNGWVAYYRLADVRGVFTDLDKWIERKLRAARWRQWKTPRIRYKALRKLGQSHIRARIAYCGRGPWFSAKSVAMLTAFPTVKLRQMGLVSLANKHREFKRSQ